MIQEYDRLPEELLDICKNTFKTHLGIEGHTGKGLDHSFRKTECRYIQRAKRVGAPQPRGIQLMEEWINEQGYEYTPEILQIARYHEGHFYKWHTDGDGRGYRKSKRFKLKKGNIKLFSLLDNHQLKDTKKMKFCDHIVVNNKSLTILKKNLLNIIKLYE